MAETIDRLWQEIEALPDQSLQSLFAQHPDRLAQFSHKLELGEAEIFFDFSKTHLDDKALEAFSQLAAQMHLAAMRDQFFAGARINVSENRSVEHIAERGLGAPASVDEAASLHKRLASFCEAMTDGVFGEIDQILHIGIGGSALGPKLLIDALGRDKAEFKVEIVSNIDGAALQDAFSRLDPMRTIVAIASKTFTTTETLMNADSALNWLEQGGVEDPYSRAIALTAYPEKALQWGMDQSRILPFRESVGGRYSIWSSIGYPVAQKLGYEEFAKMLAGAAAMDVHFRDADWHQNMPVLAAFADLYYSQKLKCHSRAVFAYDERLRLLPDYLQQLEMESNGKQVLRNGEPLARPSAPVTWGGVGTDGQHAVFQLLHQGSHIIPVEFIASVAPGHDLDPAHHQALLANCFAQGAALMQGKASEDGARFYPGNRPSSTILLDEIDAFSLGALIAFYEHRTFVNAVMLGINAFDQFGVELGKEIAKSLGDGNIDGFDLSTLNLLNMTGLSE